MADGNGTNGNGCVKGGITLRDYLAGSRQRGRPRRRLERPYLRSGGRTGCVAPAVNLLASPRVLPADLDRHHR